MESTSGNFQKIAENPNPYKSSQKSSRGDPRLSSTLTAECFLNWVRDDLEFDRMENEHEWRHVFQQKPVHDIRQIVYDTRSKAAAKKAELRTVVRYDASKSPANE